MADIEIFRAGPFLKLTWSTFAIEKAPPPNIWSKELSERKDQYINLQGGFQLPQCLLIFIFELMGKGFLKTHVVCCQTVSNIFSRAQAWLLTPFIMHVVSQQQSISFSLKYPHAISMVPIDWHSGSFGRVSLSCTPKIARNMIWKK